MKPKLYFNFHPNNGLRCQRQSRLKKVITNKGIFVGLSKNKNSSVTQYIIDHHHQTRFFTVCSKVSKPRENIEKVLVTPMGVFTLGPQTKFGFRLSQIYYFQGKPYSLH